MGILLCDAFVKSSPLYILCYAKSLDILLINMKYISQGIRNAEDSFSYGLMSAHGVLCL